MEYIPNTTANLGNLSGNRKGCLDLRLLLDATGNFAYCETTPSMVWQDSIIMLLYYTADGCVRFDAAEARAVRF